MKYWPLNQLYFVIFLAVGFFAAVPFVLGVVGAFWWIAFPLIAAWTVVIWVWGLPWIAPEEYKNSSVFEKIVATLIMLGQSLVGVVLAAFLVAFLIHEWVALILDILLVAALVFWASREPPKRKRGDPVAPPQPPVTFQEWVVHHFSLILFLVFGWFTLSDDLDRHSFVPGWPAVGMALAYVAFVWVHVASPSPGDPPTSPWHKLLITVVTITLTILVLVGLALLINTLHEVSVVVVPPIGIAALAIVLNWRNLPPWKKVPPEATPAHRGRKPHDQLAS